MKSKEGGPPIFFDAELTSFDRFGKTQTFERNVILILAGNLVSADEVHLDHEKKEVHAWGHVLVLNASRVLGGDEVRFHYDTEDFYLKNAFIISGDLEKVESYANEILGFTWEEAEFERKKAEHLKTLRKKKNLKKYEFKRLAPSQKKKMIEEYAILLEQENLISKQENPLLAQVPEAKRNAIKKRRKFWEDSKKDQVDFGRDAFGANYLRLTGSEMQRVDGNHYTGKKVSVTPCHCEEDESPVWEIQTDAYDAYAEGYADLNNAVIKVKGIPILYIPYLKVPIKGRRQSGFLFPSFSHNRFNGSVFSQPIFLDGGPDKDTTVTVDFIEKRGIKLGAAFRYQHRTYSGWEIEGEAMRDKEWLSLQSERRELSRAYNDGLQTAVASENSEPEPNIRHSSFYSDTLGRSDFWKGTYDFCLENPNSQYCQDIIGIHTEAPKNKYRYKSEWRGMTFFNPRFSVVSEGRLVSDHRYMQDLYFESYNESFNPKSPDLFTKSKAQVNLDLEDFYLGMGSSWGDQLTNHKNFTGHQIPVYMRMKSRNFHILEYPRPLFASMFFNYKRIEFFEDPSFRLQSPTERVHLKLQGGNWAQIKAKAHSPLFTKQAFTLNFVTEAEGRFVDADYRSSQSSIDPIQLEKNPERHAHIRSLRWGLDFQVPIHGVRQLSPEEQLKSEGLDFLEHRMNWGVHYSVRPSVVRQGSYSQISHLHEYDSSSGTFKPVLNSGTQFLSYFAAENPQIFDSDHILEQDRMIPHHQILFQMSHDWLTYKKSWVASPKFSKKYSSPIDKDDYRAKARNELEYSAYLADKLDILLTEEELKREGFHSSETGHNTFLHFDANISYDFYKDKRLRENRNDLLTASTDEDLLNPWSPARTHIDFKLYDWILSNKTKYDVVRKYVRETNFSMQTQSFFQTHFKFSYLIENEINLDSGETSLERTVTRGHSFSSDLIPYFTILGEYNIRTKENREPRDTYYASSGFTYVSPSDCWGLQFLWRKDYPEDGWIGTYYLSLIVKFFGYQREYSNLVSKFNDRNKAIE